MLEGIAVPSRAYACPGVCGVAPVKIAGRVVCNLSRASGCSVSCGRDRIPGVQFRSVSGASRLPDLVIVDVAALRVCRSVAESADLSACPSGRGVALQSCPGRAPVRALLQAEISRRLVLRPGTCGDGERAYRCSRSESVPQPFGCGRRIAVRSPEGSRIRVKGIRRPVVKVSVIDGGRERGPVA